MADPHRRGGVVIELRDEGRAYLDSLGVDVVPVHLQSPHGVPLLYGFFRRIHGAWCFVSCDEILDGARIPLGGWPT